MRMRVRVILGALLLVLIAGTIVVLVQDQQPSYAGRALHDWIRIYADDTNNGAVHDAICCITTNALPELIRRLEYDPGPKRMRAMRIAGRIPASVPLSGRIAEFLYRDRRAREADDAAIALMIAGHAASAAVPSLTRLALETNCPRMVSARVVAALAKVDENVDQTFAAILLNPGHSGGGSVLVQVRSIPELGEKIVSRLVRTTHEQSSSAASLATHRLGELARMNIGRQRAIAALQQAAEDPRQDVSKAAKKELDELEIWPAGYWE